MRIGSFKFGKSDDEKSEDNKAEEAPSPAETAPRSTPAETRSMPTTATPPAPATSPSPAAPSAPPAPATTKPDLAPLPASAPASSATDGLPTETVAPLGATLGSGLGSGTAAAAKPEPAPASTTPRQAPDVTALRRIVEQAVRDSEGSRLEAVRLGSGGDAPALMAGQTLNFSALYDRVGLPEPPFSAEQMLEMLAKLPAEMPLAMKRQTVDVTIGMLGKHINTTQTTIVSDTTRKMTTLATFAQEYEKKTNERVAATEAEIASLLAQVEEKRQAVQAANQRMATIQDICVTETDRLDNVLEFFEADAPNLVDQVFGQGKAEKGKESKAAARAAAAAKKAPAPAPKPAAPVPPVSPSPSAAPAVKPAAAATTAAPVAKPEVMPGPADKAEKTEKQEKAEKTDDAKTSTTTATTTASTTKP